MILCLLFRQTFPVLPMKKTILPSGEHGPEKIEAVRTCFRTSSDSVLLPERFCTAAVHCTFGTHFLRFSRDHSAFSLCSPERTPESVTPSAVRLCTFPKSFCVCILILCPCRKNIRPHQQHFLNHTTFLSSSQQKNTENTISVFLKICLTNPIYRYRIWTNQISWLAI